MAKDIKKPKIVVIGAGPVGALSALYAAQRGHDVEVYELRNGMSFSLNTYLLPRWCNKGLSKSKDPLKVFHNDYFDCNASWLLRLFLLISS
jgi:glycine/D-amino acid oxidase-like deaminating enzyme